MSRVEPTILCVGFLLIEAVAAVNVEYLSILEYSLTEDESVKCDLASFGQNMDVEYDSQRAVIHRSSNNISGSDIILKKSLIILSQCLILFTSEEQASLKEVMHLSKKVQSIKPVGVIYDIKNAGRNFDGMRWPFPIIFNHKGKCKC